MATRGVRIEPIGEYVAPADLCTEEIQFHEDMATKVGPPWKVDETDQALYPDQAASPGIGTLEKPVSYITIGSEHSGGADGALLQKEQTDGGGLILIAVKDLDPGEPIVPPLIGNAYLELNGSAVLVASGDLWLEVAQDVMEDHEVIAGPSVQIADGRKFCPLLIGAEKIYQYQQSAEDTADHDLKAGPNPVEVVAMVLTDAYTAGVSTFSFQILLENTDRKDTTFTVRILKDAVEISSYQQTVSQSSVTVSDSITISQDAAVGVRASLEVSAFFSHGNSLGDVRGTLQASVISIQQG